MTGAQLIRQYWLTQGFGRYGQDNDTDNEPLEPMLNATYGTQSPWCAAFQYVLDFGYEEPEDNVTYVPHKTPALLTIHEGGSDGSSKSSSTPIAPDAAFRYVFLGTGHYDHPLTATKDIRYCFPYLDTVETLYGPADPATPTTAYAWRDEASANPPTQSYGGLLSASYLGRYVNTVERETTYSGFAADAPAMERYYTYSSPNFEGDDDTFQGFAAVNRCEGAACSGAWTRKVTLSFLTRPYYAADAALTGRTSQQDVRAHPDTLMARTESTWSMLDADGVGGMDPSRVPVLTQQIQRDYRGADVATRAKFVYDAFGNQTQTQEFGQTLTGGTPKRTLERLYNVNLDVGGDNWVVNLVEKETLWDGPAGGADARIVRRTTFRYDGATCANSGADPALGQLTAQDQYLSGSAAHCAAGSWLTTGYTYSATRKWQVTRITDPAGRFKTYAWSNATQLGSVAYAVDGVNYTTSYTYDAVFRWQVRDVTAVNGATTRYTYDVHGRLREVKPPRLSDGAVGTTAIEYLYGDTNNPFYVEEKNWAVYSTMPPTTPPTPPTTRTFYDALGRPLQARRWNLSSDFTMAFTDTHYDALGRVSCVTPPMSDAGPADAFNTAINCPVQARTLYAYDALDEQTVVTGPDNTTTVTAVSGRQRHVTDGAGQTTTYGYDELGRLSQVTQPIAFTMTYGYTLADDLLSANGSNGVKTEMTYDKLGRKLTMDDPDMGEWRYGYDGAGNLAWQADGNNERLCFYYDAAGRLTNKRHNGQGAAECPMLPYGALLAGYIYHTAGPGKGQIQTISDVDDDGMDTFTDTYTYDYRGRVTSLKRTISGAPASYTLTTTYDAADRPTTVTYPDGKVTTLGYDREFPKSLAVNGLGELVSDLTYGLRGQLLKIDRGMGNAPDTTFSYYNQVYNYRLDEILNGAANDGLPDFYYDLYDALDNVTKLTTILSSGTETQTFTYDAVGRLRTEVVTSAGAVKHDYEYTYGLGGNITTRVNRKPNPDVARSYTYGTVTEHAHAVMSVTGDGLDATFTYDANGNMTQRTVNNVTYNQSFDVENRLTSVTVGGQTTSFRYDADGNRILTVQPNGVKVYTPFPDYEETVPTTGATTQRTTYTLAGQLIGVRVKQGTDDRLYYAYTDHLGNVVGWWGKPTPPSAWQFITDSVARYDPFGSYRTKPATTTNPDISDRGFTGHRQNNTGAYDLGLIYMNARYYVPEIGRFISADTIVPDPGNPQSFNRYSYSYNNPINYTDPSGHMATSGCDGYVEGCLSDPDTWQENYASYMITYHPELVYDEWYSSNHSGCFLCHAAVANDQVILTNQGLAAAEEAMQQAQLQGLLAAGTGITMGAAAGYFANEVQSVWQQNPFQRGVAIENALGRSPNLAQNFPVIDRFENGVATSIKSLDLGAPTYQNIDALSRVVTGYVSKLASWQGARWGGVTVRAVDITARNLILAIPQGASPQQMTTLQQVQQWATSQGVTVTYVVVP